MCSHKTIMWEIADNSVTDRMIDNTLIHKFRLSQKVRRRTKVLNAEIKKHCNLKSYKHYIELKTNILRNLAEDTDTDNSSSLTDVDYDIIYSSPSKQAKYVAKNSKRYIFTSEEDCEGCKENKREKKDRSKSTERRVQTKKSPQVKNTVISKKCIDIGWQEVTKKSSNIYTSRLRKRVHTNMSHNERNILEDNDRNCFKIQSSRQSLSLRFDSQNSTASSIMKSGNEYTKQDRRDSDAMNDELSSEDNAISNKTKPINKRKVRNHKNQNVTNKSNIELNPYNSHCQSSPSRSTNLENSNDSDNELNTLIGLEDNNNKLTAVTNESSNTKNYDDTYVSYKPELLKNVRRNLIPALEKADSTNKILNDEDIKIDKSIKDKLNYDQLLPAITSLSRHSTPLKKTQTNTSKMKDLSPDGLSLDQQKDSGIDEDSQDRFDKIKESNKIPVNQNIVENSEKTLEKPISSQQKKIDEVVEIAEDCKKDVKDAHLKFNINILEEQISKEEKESSGEKEIKNSSQLNEINMNIEINQEHKEDSSDIKKQQLLSPKQDCMKNVHSEPCNHIQKEEDDREVKKPFEEEVSLQLNKVDKDAEVSSINHEEEQDNKEDKESSEEEMQNFLQLNQIDNTTEMYSTNHEGENNRQVNEETEEKNFLQLNQDDKDAKMYLNQKDKACVKLEDTHDIRKQQLLPKVMCTEILNKRYKIILKKDNNVESIEKIDNINNNMDIVNTLIHRPNIINHNTDNWQETMVNEEKIDTPVVLETDNEEDDLNYVSPQTKKRLQQQARLNLVVSSDSSENDDEYVTTKTSREHSSDISHNSEDVKLKTDETNCASKQTKRTQEEAQCCENVHNSDQSEDVENFQLRFSESNVSCNSEESINQFRRQKQSSLLDKENTYSKSNQNEKIISTELGTRHKSENEQSAQASTKSSNTHLNISCQYRPCNLQELIEDQKLVVETMPATFTLADLSEDEEAFILNIPSKVVQSNLQGQLLTLKEKSIKFNENRYRIVCKEVGTTSCIFATGKKRKPYKIINIKNISTITVREKLPRSRKSDVSNSYSTVSSMSKPIKINNQQTDETDSKMLKVSNRRHKKRKRKESSDSEIGSALKKEKTIKNDLFLKN